MPKSNKIDARKRRHRSLRKRLGGTLERPRLVVFRSARYTYAQVVDDVARRTLVAASDLPRRKQPEGQASAESFSGKKAERAKQVGIVLARRCLDQGIAKVVFDRAGYQYHGRVSAVAAGAREGGLKF